jgi:hypothetical protein
MTWFEYFKENWKKGLSAIAAGYTRKKLDRVYNKIKDTELFKTYQRQSKFVKGPVEFASYLASMGVDLKLDDATPFRKFLKEVLIDLPSEMNARAEDGEKAKEKLAKGISKSDLPSWQKDVLISIIKKLKTEEVSSFLEAFITRSKKDQVDAYKYLQSLTEEDLQDFAEMGPDVKDLIFKVRKNLVKDKFGERISSAAGSMKKDLNQWLGERLERKGRERHGRNA